MTIIKQINKVTYDNTEVRSALLDFSSYFMFDFSRHGFADIYPETFNINLELIQNAVEFANQKGNPWKNVQMANES